MSPLRSGVCSVTASSSHGLQANTKSLGMLQKPGSGAGHREHSPDHSTESVIHPHAAQTLT